MRGNKAGWILCFFALAGMFIGNRVGDSLQATLPALAHYGSLSMAPGAFSLLDLGVTLGVSIRVNAAGVLGGLAGIALARRI